MRRKVLTTAIACALSIACIFGATACSNNNDNEPSVEVTEEQWKAAFEKTREAKNFTVKKVYDYSYISIENSEEYKYNHSRKEHSEQNSYMAENIFSIDYHGSSEYNGTKTEKIVSQYGEKENDLWYIAGGYDSEWEVYLDRFTNVTILTGLYYSTSAGTYETTFNIEDLYSSFTFENGKYKAELYEPYNSDNLEQNLYTIEIKFDKDGYVSYFSESAGKTFEAENYYSSVSLKSTIRYSDFGTTTVKIDKKAKKAIDDYKSKNPVPAN